MASTTDGSMSAIRKAAAADVPVVAEFIRRSFRDVAERFGLTPENCPTHPSNCTDAWVESALRKGVTYYVLEHDGQPCGTVAMERADADVCYLERLAVLPEHRRRGFGEALVGAVIAEARGIGARRVEIAIIAQQTDLREWYQRRGFALTRTVDIAHLPFAVTFMYIDT